MTPHRAVPVTLDRQEVLVRLTDRLGLEQVLDTVPMTAGGYHQLRITEVRPGSLYELLGLEAGDVILGDDDGVVARARSDVARELLEIFPPYLDVQGRAPRLRRFRQRAIGRLEGKGTFDIGISSPPDRDRLVADIMGTAPRLARIIGQVETGDRLAEYFCDPTPPAVP